MRDTRLVLTTNMTIIMVIWYHFSNQLDSDMMLRFTFYTDFNLTTHLQPK